MRVNFSTAEYQFSHGRQPRGIGLWAFELRLKDGARHTYWSKNPISYSDAKREVSRYVRANSCCSDVKVLP